MGKLANYLRAHRRKSHLSQEELAFLFGYSGQPIVARFENADRAVTLGVAYACELIFGVAPREVFPGLFESVEERVLERLHAMRDRLLESKPTQRTLAKLELLHDAINRITALSEREV